MRYISDEEYEVIKPQARKLHHMIREAKKRTENAAEVRENFPDIVREEAVLNDIFQKLYGLEQRDIIALFYSELLPIRCDLTELINS